jgi:hypothetical protein
MFHYCVLSDKMNKARYRLHMFYKIIKLTHFYFKSPPHICTSRIDRVNFLYFLAQ